MHVPTELLSLETPKSSACLFLGSDHTEHISQYTHTHTKITTHQKKRGGAGGGGLCGWSQRRRDGKHVGKEYLKRAAKCHVKITT